MATLIRRVNFFTVFNFSSDITRKGRMANLVLMKLNQPPGAEGICGNVVRCYQAFPPSLVYFSFDVQFQIQGAKPFRIHHSGDASDKAQSRENRVFLASVSKNVYSQGMAMTIDVDKKICEGKTAWYEQEEGVRNRFYSEAT